MDVKKLNRMFFFIPSW